MDEKQEDKEVYARIAQLLQQAHYAEAERLCKIALKTDAALNHLTWFYLGAARQFQGKVAQALEAHQRAHTMAPNDIEVINACASCFEQLERHQDAYDTLLKAYQLAPGDAKVCANLGVALGKLGKLDEALACYDAALLDDPKNLSALTNRGTLLAHLGRRQEGLAHNRQAHAALCPEQFGTLYNLVDALVGMFQYDEALAYCDAGLAWMPRHAHMIFKKGMILSCMRRFAEAQKYLSLAQIIQPDIIKDYLPGLRKVAPQVSFNVNARVLYFEAMYQQQANCFWRDRAQYIKILNDTIQSSDLPYVLVEGTEFGF